MKKVSIIVPTYNGETHIESTLHSLTAQTFQNLEIIVSDDASQDRTRALVANIQALDNRIVLIGDGANHGTLGARKRGVAVSTGDYVMLVDQDDELSPDAVSQLVAFAENNEADIYHFSATVIPENEEATEAAAGMQSFLTPPERVLIKEEILLYQLKMENGFDWHLHHKMYDGEFLRKAYACAPDVRLVQADDFYMCFIISALARAYYGIPSMAHYRYHLGRGETFGNKRTVHSVLQISANNTEAYRLIKAFTESSQAPRRSDWRDRLSDARCCLLDYPINEWKDGLDRAGQLEALPGLLNDWPAEFVVAELWRFSRDTAYAFWIAKSPDQENATEPRALQLLEDKAKYYFDIARETERAYKTEASSYPRYQNHRNTALAHLRDSGLCSNAPQKSPLHGLSERVMGLLRH